MQLTIAGILVACPSVVVSADEKAAVIQLDAASPGRVFEGIGAVSAGASTRLLIDYPEPQRGQILDFLFKPRFGAGFQHLKVEIGSGENSTCGSEPSHAITRAELADPKPRGYEFWFMAEARKRNPKIILDCLPWGYPHWVGSRFSQESADWFVAFLEVARKHYGLELDWISAGQNEMGTDLNWIQKNLRPALDAHGFSKVKLQAPDDDGEYWQVFDALEKDPELDRLISAGLIQDLPPGKLTAIAGQKYCVNVGSVGQPRDRDARSSYVIYDPDAKSIVYRRVTYPIEQTQSKIIKKGLPDQLAYRLLRGV